jgi:hypothetical protein
MQRRDDWDDDYDRPRSRDQGSGIMPWLVIGGLGLGLTGIVALGVVVLLSMARDERPDEEPAPPPDVVAGQGNQLPPPIVGPGNQVPPPIERRAPVIPPRGAPQDNWARLIGSWRLVGSERHNELNNLVVRPDRTARLEFHYADGRIQTHETRVVITSQGQDSIGAQFHVSMGTYFYSFSFHGDDRISRDGRNSDLVFERVK